MTKLLKKGKIIHISYMKIAPSGVVNQLRNEKRCTSSNSYDWETVLFTTSDLPDSYVKILNKRCPSIFHWIRVYWWILMNQKYYSHILLRYIKSDLVGWIFMPFIKNLISIHHTKEIEECLLIQPPLYGRFLSKCETIFGKLKLHQIERIAAVTEEIARYEVKRGSNSNPIIIIPNGIDTKKAIKLNDKRKGKVKALFVASRFEPWHGLELLLDSIEKAQETKIEIHLVGSINDLQWRRIEMINHSKEMIIFHGVLKNEEIIELIPNMDVGLASFAMYFNDLNEACTLKVREYLNYGLPVFSGHKDSGIPQHFEFYKCHQPEVIEIIKYAKKMRQYDRSQIRNAAIPYIDKGLIINKTIESILNK